jgi:hypothetical protein
MKNQLVPRNAAQQNARRITELHDRVSETVRHRDTSPEARAEWQRACAEFHRQYDALAFPGGYEAGLQKIRDGDSRAIEDALAFIEARPYFFRSQYIRAKLTRLLKHAPLSPRQTDRFQRVLEASREYKRTRNA